MMDEQLKARIDALRDMMATPGWKILMIETQQNLDTLSKNALSHAKTPDEFWRLRGHAEALFLVLRYEQQLDATEEAAQKAAEAENANSQ